MAERASISVPVSLDLRVCAECDSSYRAHWLGVGELERFFRASKRKGKNRYPGAKRFRDMWQKTACSSPTLRPCRLIISQTDGDNRISARVTNITLTRYLAGVWGGGREGG